ncbi:MAG: head GIN domain-containing protein [Bacteroidia bacterium]
MRKLVRFFVYLFVIAGAYYFFNWIGSDDNDKHHEHVSIEHVEEHHDDHDGHGHDIDGHRHSIHASEIETLESFSKLSVSGAYEVHLTQGDGYTLEAKGNDDDLDRLRYEVNGDKLKVYSEDGTWKFDDEIHLYITSPTFESIHVSGGVELETENTIESDVLAINVSGAADLDLNLAVDDLRVGLSGAANAELEGSAESASYSVSGAGHIDADDLKSSSVKIDLSGAAAADVYATESLDVKISGAGSVSYKGDPEVRKSISGLGSVRKK